jgi:hypothetical protein
MSKPIGMPGEHPDKDRVFVGTTRFSPVSAMTALLAFCLRAGVRSGSDASILPQAMAA